MPKTARLATGLVTVIVGFGALQACGGHHEAATPAITTPAPVPANSLCPRSAPRPVGDYDGSPGCRPGEAVEIARVVDASTFELADGRRVRLGGVVVGDPTSCRGRQALANTLGHVQVGVRVNLVVEPGAGADQRGNLWVHLQFDPPGYAEDLGATLASEGLAEASPEGANPRYAQQIQSLVDTARNFHIGQYGPLCGG